MVVPTPRIQKVIAPNDDVAEGGYYTIPPIQIVASTASVENFVIIRKGYGSISFKGPVDLTEIPNLSTVREYVQIERNRVAVYPDKSKYASPGTGLNVTAEVKVEGLRRPPDIGTDVFLGQLQSTPNTKFVSYDEGTGVWIYTVDHFSTIAVPNKSELTTIHDI